MERHQVIERFIESYVQRLDFFRTAAELCHDQCREVLVHNGIRLMVTYRAKREDPLRKKLYQRASDGHQYSAEEDIVRDIADLSGVRVALYFPGDAPSAIALLKKQLNVVHERIFPTPGERRGADSYTYRFRGYAAVHLHAFLRPETLDDRRYAAARIEIQVASVFMHAWAEVEHDLVYKPLQGELSTSEYCLLDQVNGLAFAGELALEQLQRQMQARISDDARFRNHYDLASFIHRRTSDIERLSTCGMGRADRLLRFLQAEQLNRPALLMPFLAKLDERHDSRPLVDQLVSYIVTADATLSDKRRRLWRAIESDTVKTDPYGQAADIEALEGHLVERRLAKCHSTFETIVGKVLTKLSAGDGARVSRWAEKNALQTVLGFDSRSADALISAHHAFTLLFANRWRGPDDELRDHVQSLEAAIRYLYTNFPEILESDVSHDD